MLAAIDVIGVRDFVYGGDPEWVRRRWLLAVSMAFNALLMVCALISAAAGRLPVELAETVISSGFGLIMVVVPGFLGIAAYERQKMARAASTETISTVTEPGPPATTTTTTETRPNRDAEGRPVIHAEEAG